MIAVEAAVVVQKPSVEVEGIPIRALLEQITTEIGGPVDLLKVDTEGSEPELVAAMPAGMAREIRYELSGRVVARRGA